MSTVAVGYIGLLALLLLLAIRLPIGLCMAMVGFVGLSYIRGLEQALEVLGNIPYVLTTEYSFSVLPLFVVMSNFMFFSEVGKDLYLTAYKWLGHLRGGLAIATIAACAAFSAVTGSSGACALTIGSISLPEMKRHGYHPELSTGCIAAGGTLGILIPPSNGFIIYSMLTGISLGKLFVAAILPGILLASLFMFAIYFITQLNPHLGPQGPSLSFKEKLKSLKGSWMALILFILVIGGMYLGVFTPTEAAGIGAFAALVIMYIRGKLTRRSFIGSLLDSGKIVGMVYIILMGAMILNPFIAFTRIPSGLANFIATTNLPPIFVFFFMLIIYMFLGCIMDTIAMITLTIPIFFPVLTTLGFDPLWFGVIVVIYMEMGLITPPIGINVFIVGGIAKEVPMYTIFRGVIPFLLCMIVCLFIMFYFPQLATFLPSRMS